MHNCREFDVIETDQRQVLRNTEPAAKHGRYHTEGHYVVGRENRGDLRVFVQQLPGQFGTAIKIEFSVEHDGVN